MGIFVSRNLGHNAHCVTIDEPRLLLRGREVETRQPHKLKTGGANPSPATKLL